MDTTLEKIERALGLLEELVHFVEAVDALEEDGVDVQMLGLAVIANALKPWNRTCNRCLAPLQHELG